MAGDESLFSLEVYVEIVENVCVMCYIPAIAFRFLDFPTVVIRSEREEVCSKEKSLQILSGKSCLFKMSKEVLGEKLRSTPLYVMFVDISSGRAKLLASTTISMVNCFENILTSIEENGLDIPAVSGRQGEFHLYNLMGSHVGTVKLRYRMFSFGVGMTGHVNLSLSKKRASKNNIQTDSLPEQCGEDTHIKESCYGTEFTTTENKMSIIQDLVKESCVLRTDVETQTENADTKQLNAASHQKYNNPEPSSSQPHNNILRPPPLYYNSISTFTKARIVSGHSVRKQKKDVTSRLQYCDRSTQTSRPSHSCSNNVSSNMPTMHEDASTQCHSKYDLPLIEALLNELSLVRTQYGNNDELTQQLHNSGISPGKNKQVKNVNIADVSSKRLQVQKHKVEKVQLDTRKSCCKPKPTRAGSKSVLISRNTVKFKKSSLTYGTTKTQKLREAMTKKVIHGEQSIQLPRSQVEPSLSEDKRECSNAMQNDRMVVHKSSQTFGENKSTMTQNGKTQNGKTQNGKTQLKCQDVGVQVRISKDDFPTKGLVQKQKVQESLLGHDGTTNVVLGATYVNDAFPVMISTNHNGNAGEVDASDRSLKEAEEISPNNVPFLNLTEVPTFSDVSPKVPVAANINYSNSEKSKEESQDKSLSTDSRSSDKSLDLVNKPVGEILAHSSYSDNFDSDASTQTEDDNTN